MYNDRMHLLAVGSTVIDIFLKPTIDTPEKDKISFTPGDKIPTDLVATAIGGNAANVATVIKSLGHDTTLYTYLATDFFSKELEQGLVGEGIKLIAEKVPGKSDFSIVMITGKDRVIFSHHENRNHTFSYQGTHLDVIYLTSIGDDWKKAYAGVTDYVAKNQTTLALSPGSPQLNNLDETFFSTLKASKFLLCNLTEADKIIKATSQTTQNIPETLSKLHDLGPQIISITDGENGAYASDKTSAKKIGTIPGEYTEKTGAGDTYAATFLAWYTEKNDLGEAMKAGVIAATHVMKKVGSKAGILNHPQLSEALTKYPDLTPQDI